VDALRARGGRADGLVADLASLAEAARLAGDAAARAPRLDVVIHDAGVGFGADPTRREVSRDGHELRLAVNHLAPALVTAELGARGLPRRAIVYVASAGQEPLDFDDLQSERDYHGVRAYRRSKLAMIMASFDVADARPDLGVAALHPGTFLDTTMVREAGIAPLGTAADGARAVVAVLAAALAGGRGYFDQDRPARAHPQAYDPVARARLREATGALIAPFRAG